MTVLVELDVILDGQLMWIMCIIIYMGDYIEKLDNQNMSLQVSNCSSNDTQDGYISPPLMFQSLLEISN